MIKITEKRDIEELQHINQIQYITIHDLSEKIKSLEAKVIHLEQLLRFTPIIIKPEQSQVTVT